MAEKKQPGLACLITGIMSLVIVGIMKMLKPGYITWFMVFLLIFTVVMFLISLINRKEVVLAVIGLLMGIVATVWFFLG